MKKILLNTTFFLIALTGFSQSFTNLSYNSATSDAFDGISGDCNIGIKISTTQNGVFIEHYLQSFDLKTLRIVHKDIPASQVPSYVILDKSVDVTFDLYVNNVFIERYGQPSVSWARLQGLPNSDGYKPSTKENGYKLFNSGAISIRNVKIKKLTYRVEEKYYTKIRTELAGVNNKNTTANAVKQGNSTSLTIENGSSNNNPVTQTGTPTKTSGNDPLAHFETDGKVLTNPMVNNTNTGITALDNFNKGYQQGQQIANIATGIIDLFGPSPEKIAKKEREEILRLQQEENNYKARVQKVKLIAARKTLINNYPDGKSPLSSQAQDVSEVYYFVYSYVSLNIESEAPEIYISEIFASKKYEDGTWQFKKT